MNVVLRPGGRVRRSYQIHSIVKRVENVMPCKVHLARVLAKKSVRCNWSSCLHHPSLQSEKNCMRRLRMRKKHGEETDAIDIDCRGIIIPAPHPSRPSSCRIRHFACTFSQLRKLKYCACLTVSCSARVLPDCWHSVGIH